MAGIKDKITMGMFTVHQEMDSDMPGTLEALADMGYTGIEFYGEPEFDISSTREALDTAGIELTSWHIEWRNLQPSTIETTIQYLRQIGCPIAVVPCLGGKWNVNHTPNQENRGLWVEYVEKMNAMAEILAQGGIRMGYHNHEHEFQLEYEDQTVFDLLFENLRSNVILEFDTGNCIEGGCNPTEVIRKYGDREILLHLKPYSHQLGFDVVLGDEHDLNDWSSILAASTKDYLRLIVESECTLYSGLDNAKRCMEGLRRFL